MCPTREYSWWMQNINDWHLEHQLGAHAQISLTISFKGLPLPHRHIAGDKVSSRSISETLTLLFPLLASTEEQSLTAEDKIRLNL